ncbi:MAG: hypothetical protein GY781_17135 [Gammaproteobacteria bacterium]|nr:hypothetical protein [Gammaproteobacteria bacterium]
MIDWLLAADIYLTLGGWSDHSDDGYELCKEEYCERASYNENHNAIIADIGGFTIGTYENSYYERTNLVGYTYHWEGFAITGAYGTGYREVLGACRVDLGKECLLITASYSFEPFKLSLMGDALALSFEFKLM